jgi:hypothetical protein
MYYTWPPTASAGRRDAVAPAAKITRDRVVAQALKVIAQEGVGMLTMRTLAARLGVVPGALYRHGPGQLLRSTNSRATSSWSRPAT